MFQQIAYDPGILGGKPYIRGTRLSVEFILELFASVGKVTLIFSFNKPSRASRSSRFKNLYLPPT